MMSYEDQVSGIAAELEEVLDLDDLEAKVYLNLLRAGPITASALAKELDIDRARMYRTVDKLVSRNIISTTLSSPKLCIAADPHEALKITLGKKEDEVNKIKKSGEAIIEKINNEITTNQSSSVPTFRVVQGRQNIYADIAQMVEETKDVLYIVTTLDDVSRMYHSTIPEKITICEKNGGSVRLLVDMNDAKLTPFVKRFNATETRIGNLPSKGRLIVQKDKKMIMSDSASSFQHSSADSDFSLCTNSTEMVDNIFTLCKFLWETSNPLKTIDVKNFVKN
ncbi:TrmB family transcriptional regulator [Candidatus Nitrosopumilus koreensis AR1]|uniref:TrmB family transcriptional regulator n=1 Tax=Candidatus Nitrosopumilus koreensis AR1 TaxID=1229908 RepID=K0B948_9ARCH|nr:MULTISPECIES: helix-turn-helix domain-containing protein [Nitrosopumilus]AFS80951.1 TrmB family transcriptional regulator [Candidatus Nitrosopumilus koreensis AR1]